MQIGKIKRPEKINKLQVLRIFSDLGIFGTLINKYEILEAELAKSKTKYREDSIVIKNIKQRLKILLPEIREKQLKAIDLAISSNNSEIDISKERLLEINEELQLQPTLISEYQKLKRKLYLSKKNLDSLISAIENFLLHLAQKSLPWSIIENQMFFLIH